MSVTLTNTTRRTVVLNLPHQSYCKALGRCACSPHPLREDATVATSLTIPAGQVAPDLPEAVLAAPEVDRAVKTGELRVEQFAAPAPSPESDTPTGRKAKTDKSTGGDR